MNDKKAQNKEEGGRGTFDIVIVEVPKQSEKEVE